MFFKIVLRSEEAKFWQFKSNGKNILVFVLVEKKFEFRSPIFISKAVT